MLKNTLLLSCSSFIAGILTFGNASLSLAGAFSQAVVLATLSFQLLDYNLCVGTSYSKFPRSVYNQGTGTGWGFGEADTRDVDLNKCGPNIEFDGTQIPYKVQVRVEAHAEAQSPFGFAFHEYQVNLLFLIYNIGLQPKDVELFVTSSGIARAFATEGGSSTGEVWSDFDVRFSSGKETTTEVLQFPAVNNNRVDKSADKSLKITIDGGILTPDGVIAKNKVDIQLNGAARAIASYEVPEPTSTLSLLALGFLGTALTLKRKLKSSQSTEKETTKVG